MPFSSTWASLGGAPCGELCRAIWVSFGACVVHAPPLCRRSHFPPTPTPVKSRLIEPPSGSPIRQLSNLSQRSAAAGDNTRCLRRDGGGDEDKGAPPPLAAAAAPHQRGDSAAAAATACDGDGGCRRARTGVQLRGMRRRGEGGGGPQPVKTGRLAFHGARPQEERGSQAKETPLHRAATRRPACKDATEQLSARLGHGHGGHGGRWAIGRKLGAMGSSSPAVAAAAAPQVTFHPPDSRRPVRAVVGSDGSLFADPRREGQRRQMRQSRRGRGARCRPRLLCRSRLVVTRCRGCRRRWP